MSKANEKGGDPRMPVWDEIVASVTGPAPESLPLGIDELYRWNDLVLGVVNDTHTEVRTVWWDTTLTEFLATFGNRPFLSLSAETWYERSAKLIAAHSGAAEDWDRARDNWREALRILAQLSLHDWADEHHVVDRR